MQKRRDARRVTRPRHAATIGRRVGIVAVFVVIFFVGSDGHNFVTDSHITLPAHTVLALVLWGLFGYFLAVGYARNQRGSTGRASEDGPA